MRIKYDKFGRNEPSIVYLAKPDRTILYALNGIDETSVSFTGRGIDTSEITFDLHRYVELTSGDIVESNGYEFISKYMKLYITNIGWFVVGAPEQHNDGSKEYKTIPAYSAQAEYNQVPLDGWKVNNGTTDSLEMLIDENVEVIDGVEFAKENIKFHNPDNPKLSLIDILISKVPGWEIGYVDDIPKNYTSYDENGNKVETQVLLKDEVGMFDISYDSALSFIYQDMQKYFNCVVEFDYLNYVVNFYRVENYGKDTNVVIGFSNIENSNDITIDEDNIYTKFKVSGDNNLGIEQFNGGSNYIIHLSDFWLNEKYLSQSTIEKYQTWDDFCKSARYAYANLSRKWNSLQDTITELYDRLPLADVDPENWSSLEITELETLKADYEAEKLGYEKIYVDEDGNFDIGALNASTDANRYHQIVDSILPNIDIEIANRELPTSEGETDYLEEYETKWEWYGLNELKLKLQTYKDAVSILRKNHYDLSWDEYKSLSEKDPVTYPPKTVDGFNDNHIIYEEKERQLDEYNQDSCAYAVIHRQAQIDDKLAEQKEVNTERSKLAEQLEITTWKDSKLGSFTESELIEINHILNQTSYQNENIFVANNEGIVDTVDVQQQLYEAAMEEIPRYSYPQTQYTTSIDNILSAVGNELHAHDLYYGNFIRFGVRDDYYVKLRVIEMSYNPLLYDNDFSIKFSNMIRCSNSYNDYLSLLDASGNLTKSSTSISGSGNSQITDDNIYSLLQKILQSTGFSNKVQNIINNTTNISGDTLRYGDIYGSNAFLDYVQSKLVISDEVIANNGTFKKLESIVADINTLLAGNISGEIAQIIHLTAQNVQIDEAVIRDLIASQITVSMLQAGDITLTDEMKILSENGLMVMNGETLQIMGTNAEGEKYVAIQLGYDAKNNPSLIIRDANGTVMLDGTGLHEGIIPDGLIKTDMISNGAITEDKIDKSNIREWTDENGNRVFDISKLYYGDDKFEVTYNQFKQEVINEIPFRLELFSSSGNMFLNGMIDTYLSITLYKGNEDVTAQYPDSCFIWTRQSSDVDLDDYWNSQHSSGAKSLHITREDIYKKAQFRCSFWLDDEVVATTQ